MPQFPIRISDEFGYLLAEFAKLTDGGNKAALLHRLVRAGAREVIAEAVKRGHLDANHAAINEKYHGEDGGLGRSIAELRAARDDFEADEEWATETDDDGKEYRVLLRRNPEGIREVQKAVRSLLWRRKIREDDVFQKAVDYIKEYY